MVKSVDELDLYYVVNRYVGQDNEPLTYDPSKVFGEHLLTQQRLLIHKMTF